MSEPNSQRAVVVYDGDCAFCRNRAKAWESRDGGNAEFIDNRTAVERFPQLEDSRVRESLHVIVPDGRILRGAEAVLYLKRDTWPLSWAYAGYRMSTLIARAAEWCYALIARNRHRLPGGSVKSENQQSTESES